MDICNGDWIIIFYLFSFLIIFSSPAHCETSLDDTVSCITTTITHGKVCTIYVVTLFISYEDNKYGVYSNTIKQRRKYLESVCRFLVRCNGNLFCLRFEESRFDSKIEIKMEINWIVLYIVLCCMFVTTLELRV